MERNLGACGIDCNGCPIPKIHTERKIAEQWVKQFKEWDVLKADEGADEIIARGPYCIECRGDRSVHWSANCWILKCCVDEKGLQNCSECADFPCQKLVVWSQEHEGNQKALETLKHLKESNLSR